jgi:hypothetical protein
MDDGEIIKYKLCGIVVITLFVGFQTPSKKTLENTQCCHGMLLATGLVRE